MPRPGLDTRLVTAFSAKSVQIIFMFEGNFLTSHLYLWTGTGELSCAGKIYQGAGELLGISPVRESGDLQALGITVSLAGMDETVISAAFNELRQGQLCNVYVAPYAFQPSPVMLANPYCFFSGRVDVPIIDDSAETAVVSLALENRLIDFERERVRFYDSLTQNTYFPGDKGFDYVAALQDQKIFWGVSN
jgi:hypothetical protein